MDKRICISSLSILYDGQICTMQDYPSIYQLRQVIRSSQTNIVFAITGNILDDYMVSYNSEEKSVCVYT